MDLSWAEIHWSDPEGGTVLLHGVLPTVVLPRRLWPRIEWHGICLPASSDEVEIWEEEEKYELEDPGVNLQSALLGGGITGIYLDELLEITDLQVGRFPDPEPRRLHRAAVANDRPVFFAEPDLDDELWVEHITAEAKEMTKLMKLKYLYLGYFIKNVDRMNYKVLFSPGEVFENGKWNVLDV